MRLIPLLGVTVIALTEREVFYLVIRVNCYSEEFPSCHSIEVASRVLLLTGAS